MNQRGSAAIWIIILLVLIASAGYVYLQKDSALPVTEDAATSLIVGTWQSKDDVKSVVVYNNDGSSADVYDGETLGGGTWTVSGVSDGDGQVTLSVLDGTEKFVYTILELDNEQLTLSYMPRGNTLKYKRLTDEEVFNLSGQAKAIEQESDLWQVYSDDASGVSFNYPHNIILTDNPTKDSSSLRIMVEVTAVDTITEGTLGFDRESVLANKAALEGAEYGNGVDSPIQVSETLRKVGNAYAQDLVVFGRFEVCNVTFERKLYFFNNNHSVLITLYGAQEDIMQESDSYFTTNTNNCGEETIWDFDKQEGFYNSLASGTAGKVAQEWYDAFDKIVDTIQLQ